MQPTQRTEDRINIPSLCDSFDNRLNTKKAVWNHLENQEAAARTKRLHTAACSLQAEESAAPYLRPAGSPLANQ